MLKKIAWCALALTYVQAQDQMFDEGEVPTDDVQEQEEDEINSSEQDPNMQENEENLDVYNSDHKGRCPELKNTMHLRGETLDHKKLMGQWKTIYNSKQRQENAQCWSEKLQTFDGAQGNQFNLWFGFNQTGDSLPKGFFHDDSQYLSFTNKDDPTLAYIQTLEMIKDPEMKEIKERIKTETRTLTDDEKAKMSQEELEEFDLNKNYILEQGEDIFVQIENQLKENQLHLLDTDYDNYGIYWTCKEEIQKMNKDGQDEETVSYLKEQNPNEKYDENYTENYFHAIETFINVRSLDPKVLTSDKITSYIGKLHSMVPGHDWAQDTQFVIADHHKDCVSETIDMFEHPDSNNMSELEEGGDGLGMMGGDMGDQDMSDQDMPDTDQLNQEGQEQEQSHDKEDL